MEKLVKSTCRAAYMHIRRINSFRGFLTEHATEILMASTVLTRLDYCNSTYIVRWTPPEIAVQVTVRTEYCRTCGSRTYSETPS